MNITRYGRVEADLNRIPVGASYEKQGLSAFEQALQARAAEEPRPQPEAPPQERPRTDEAPATAPALPHDVARRDATEAAPAGDDAPVTTAAGSPAAGAAGGLPQQAGPVIHDTTGREEPGRHESAGKGTGSSLTSPDLPGVAAPQSPGVRSLAVATTGVTGVATAGNAPAGGEARGAWPAVDAPRAAARRAPTAGAAYRSVTPQSAQMLEAARDSVFKQILVRLSGEQSEMRVRLEPPDLGQLDLRMTVEKNGQLRLFVNAERHDLAAMLQRNLPELAAALQQGGLQVVHAEVHGGRRDPGARGGDADSDWHGGGAAADTVANPSSLARGGWISAEGLDFWV